ncbi:MAG: putative inner membrane protein [Candidatus Westeberhardia cardiocondylae]|nr:putative inner membrane protein [Candidatus Westeberhardia cardiocondylae]
MECLINPSMLVGLLALIILEIVLGIDNIFFIIVLTRKLPPKKRKSARIVGLIFALIMRLGLLSWISWMVTFTKPLFQIFTVSFSGRDLILLFGGIFLLFKTITELHERLKNKIRDKDSEKNYSGFWTIILQIVFLDAIFSLDAAVTAVGMVNNVSIMMIAVIISILIMLHFLDFLTKFINAHQEIIILCLGFLLIIGLSLILEGFGLHVPKGYLYFSIGFSALIELFNQIAFRNFIKYKFFESSKTCTRETILPFMDKICIKSRYYDYIMNINTQNVIYSSFKKFYSENKKPLMMNKNFSLYSKTLRSIMTPRNKINWLDCKCSSDELLIQLMNTSHNIFPACNGKLDQLIGIISAKDIILAIEQGKNIRNFISNNPAIVVLEDLNILYLLNKFQQKQNNMFIVCDIYGVVQGLITPVDILKEILGNFSNSNNIIQSSNDFITNRKLNYKNYKNTF